uniref:Pectate lyase n=1 Tax=Manihot esculenta TaxID=3983 RepID=A0A2C9UEB1_MANES
MKTVVTFFSRAQVLWGVSIVVFVVIGHMNLNGCDEDENSGGKKDLLHPHRWRQLMSLKGRGKGRGNQTRRQLGKESCRTGNPIDASGRRDSEFYVVTDSENDDPVNPIPRTLRYGVIQEELLWIIFDHDMVMKLKAELIMNSHKTIDGRGYNIQIAGGACIAIQYVSNIIIHNIYIRDCIPDGNTMVRDSPKHVGIRGYSDGDGISIFGARDGWIDHCTLSNCRDGLIDAVAGSTSITISNSYMLHHNEVMLMGHGDDYLDDKNMQVTIAFNFFGEGLTQRMPRCRHGYFHIVNNIYTGWEMYAIGGSANPTINNGDVMLNGAFFTPSGETGPGSYMKASSMVARPASFLTNMSPPGALYCQRHIMLATSRLNIYPLFFFLL